jgi:hypothetical protein
MKKLFLALVLVAMNLTVLATQKETVNENFVRKIVSPDGQIVVLAYGQTHKYVKILNRRTVEVDGTQYRLVMFNIKPLGRVWHLTMIYNK